MKTWKKIALLIGILLLAFGLTVLQIARHRGESFIVVPTGIGVSGESASGYDQKGYTVCVDGEERFSAKEIRSLDLDWLSGSVTVERHDGGELIVRETASAGLREDECLRWRLTGGELFILPCSNKVRDLPDKQLTILVPRSLTLKRLNADAASASVLVRGIDADGRLSLDTASGAIRAEDCRCGEMSLDSASGSQSVLRCELRGGLEADLASGSFSADTLSCSALDVDGASGSQRYSALACGTLRVSVASGSVYGEELRVGEVKVDGGSGSVELGFAASPERVEVDTASGSVKLAFPRGTGLDLDYDSASGRLKGEVVYGDLPVEVDTASGNLTIEYRG